MTPSLQAIQRTNEGTATHRWFDTKWGHTVCRDCGVVLQASGLHRPCRGEVRVVLREASADA